MAVYVGSAGKLEDLTEIMSRSNTNIALLVFMLGIESNKVQGGKMNSTDR